jgi:arylsulfatase A-like enzyme
MEDRQMPDDATATPRFGPLAIIASALFVGLLTGWAELGMLQSRALIGSRVTVDLLRLNRHASWMIPASDAALFFAVGLLLAFGAILHRGASGKFARVVLGVLACWAILWRVPGLHEAARLLLACGLGYRLAKLSWSHPAASSLVLRWGLPVTLSFTAIVGGIVHQRVTNAEARTLAALPKPKPGAPNVLLLVLDTVRADHLSLYGYERETTPNLTRVAKEGIVFRQARATAPWTLPSHASMLTGRWPHQLSADAEHAMNRRYATLGESLSAQGYTTAGFVANTYYCNAAYGLDRGFTRYEDHYENHKVSPFEVARSSSLGRVAMTLAATAGWCPPIDAGEGKNADRINSDLLRWIGGEAKDRPFFAFVNYIDAHDPYLLPAGNHPHFGLVPTTPADLDTLRGWHESSKVGVTEHQIELVRDAYDDCIRYLDTTLGRLFDELERRGLRENTLVIVTADHGEQLGEHRLFGHGRSLYSKELHVPLVVFLPGNRQGRVIDEPATLRELPATIAEFTASDPFPGQSLSRLWRAEQPIEPTPLLAEVAHQAKTTKKRNRPPAWLGPMASIQQGEFVYIRNADGREELYNLARDPGEVRDLASSYPSRIDQFRATLRQLRQGHPLPLPPIAVRPAASRIVR